MEFQTKQTNAGYYRHSKLSIVDDKDHTPESFQSNEDYENLVDGEALSTTQQLLKSTDAALEKIIKVLLPTEKVFVDPKDMLIDLTNRFGDLVPNSSNISDSFRQEIKSLIKTYEDNISLFTDKFKISKTIFCLKELDSICEYRSLKSNEEYESLQAPKFTTSVKYSDEAKKQNDMEPGTDQLRQMLQTSVRNEERFKPVDISLRKLFLISTPKEDQTNKLSEELIISEYPYSKTGSFKTFAITDDSSLKEEERIIGNGRVLKITVPTSLEMRDFVRDVRLVGLHNIIINRRYKVDVYSHSFFDALRTKDKATILQNASRNLRGVAQQILF